MVLTPTLADPPPRIGHLDPAADYEQIIERLIDWLAFTPLQNATGDPAISLPLGESATGLPVGMMFSAVMGRRGTASGTGVRTRRGAALGTHPGMTREYIYDHTHADDDGRNRQPRMSRQRNPLCRRHNSVTLVNDVAQGGELSVAHIAAALKSFGPSSR